VKWGLIPSAGGTMKLIDQIGYAAAMDLLLTGRFIGRRPGGKVGLVNETCDPAEVWPRALQRAEMIAAASPHAVRAAKQAALAERSARYAAQEAAERRLAADLWRPAMSGSARRRFSPSGRRTMTTSEKNFAHYPTRCEDRAATDKRSRSK